MSAMTNRNLKQFDWLEQYLDIQQQMIDYELEIKRTKLELIRWQSGDLKAVEINSRSKSAHLEETIEKLTGWINQDKGLLVELDKLVARFDTLDNQIMYLNHCKDYTLMQVAEQLGYEHNYVRQEHASIMKRIDFMNDYGDIVELNKRNRKASKC